MKAVAGVMIAALLVVAAIPFGILVLSVAAITPAITEQIRIDPCSAYATTTAHLASSPVKADPAAASSGFALPKWGTPRQQSLHSPAQTIPPLVKALYVAAAARYRVPWQLLAGIGMAETRHGHNNTTSSAGAQGLMQFMPGTFAAYGVDGNNDGRKQIHNDADSVFSAGHYLVASGVKNGSSGVIKALWAYNRSISYRNDVLYYAWSYAGKGGVIVNGQQADPQDCLPIDGEIPDFDGSCPKSGSAAERGLRPTALYGLRCLKAAFPAIVSMGGRAGRPISTSDHPFGLAVDFMIPKWSTRPGNAFGWKVARWVQANHKKLRVKYIIWDVQKWNPAANNKWRPYRHPLGNSNPTLAHRDHVHVSFLNS